MVTAPKGKAVSGFPKELIVEEGVRIAESYRVQYSDDKIAQPVVAYVSEKGIVENITAFRVYFVENGWQLLEEGNATDVPATFIFATNEVAQANVNLQLLPNGKTQVTIAYSSKG